MDRSEPSISAGDAVLPLAVFRTAPAVDADTPEPQRFSVTAAAHAEGCARAQDVLPPIGVFYR